MTEDFLHYTWKFRLYADALQLGSGERITVLQPGRQNINAGPDFFDARIKIGEKTWAGNVEIHLSGSDWVKHGHHRDAAYNNVILHVVFNDDTPALNANGRRISTLDISKYMEMDIYNRYQQFLKSRTWVPCQGQLQQVDKFVIHNWLDRLVVNRLQRKAEAVDRLLQLTNNDWSEAFWLALARNFGFNVNAEPMERLARSLRLATLAKHKNNLLQLEALLFGQAGFLEEKREDEYFGDLQGEFRLLAKKFRLQPMEKAVWKFARLRPPNFPTVRLAQLAQLIYKSSGLFSRVLQAQSVKELTQFFNIKVSGYWKDHYTFEKRGINREKKLGNNSVELIIINTIVPILFVYGKRKGREEYCEKALTFLENLKGEQNSIISKWSDLGMPVKTAYQTQGLLELKKEFCEQKKCLHCSIGMKLLGRESKMMKRQ